MCQNSKGCNSNDYSQQTANTGIGQVALANPNLDGSGEVVTIFTAGGDNGSIIKSITIKSLPSATSLISGLSFSQEGMVRLYIQNDDASVTTLYKEVPIPPAPSTNAMPLPVPMYTTFETMLMGDLKLQPGYSLLASTAVANTFNIIAEGVDWNYPDPVPDVCCNFEQDAAVTGMGVVSVANPNYDGTGDIVDLFTADPDANGTIIKSITIKALQSTHEGVVRIFIGPDKARYSLMREIHIPQTEQSAFVPSFKQVIDMNFKLEAGYIIAASTQNPEAFAITVEGESWIYPS